VNVSGGYERLSTNGYVQDYDTLFWDANSSNALSNAAQCGEAQFFYPPRLHRPLIPVPPALTGAAITVLAFAEPFIAAGAAVGFWYFFPTEKGLGPRGYERNEIINAWWVTPSTREFVI
jgi:hypothetical protein